MQVFYFFQAQSAIYSFYSLPDLQFPQYYKMEAPHTSTCPLLYYFWYNATAAATGNLSQLYFEKTFENHNIKLLLS